MNSTSENSEKIAAVKELHNLVKTKCLLLRDLPFITRISKYYDVSIFDNSLASDSISSSKYATFGDDKSLENPFNYQNAIKDNGHLTDTINSHNNYEDDVMTLMQAQIPKSDTLDGKSQEEITDEDINNSIDLLHN